MHPPDLVAVQFLQHAEELFVLPAEGVHGPARFRLDSYYAYLT